MRILAVDSNSIMNRAYYGIKVLTTKDGFFTNAIFGFLNILLSAKAEVKPDAIVFAFDVHAPTFRHKMFEEYKAGRHPTPQELLDQFPVIKELLRDMGYPVIEIEGWEADDILGTVSRLCEEQGGECFISTGDRDSLQLIGPHTKVRLASTKMGASVSEMMDEAAVMEKYGVTPVELIQVKALMGDSSDNIPGVPGIGEKTALDLISRYHGVEYIYEHLDEIEAKPSVLKKLEAGRDLAMLSLRLGKIDRFAPIPADLSAYEKQPGDEAAAAALLAKLEMFKMIDRLGLDPSKVPERQPERIESRRKLDFVASDCGKLAELSTLPAADILFEASGDDLLSAAVLAEDKIYFFENDGFFFNSAFGEFLASPAKKRTDDLKFLCRWALCHGASVQNCVMDSGLAGYILSVTGDDYAVAHLAQIYHAPAAEIAEIPDEHAEILGKAAVFSPLCDILQRELEGCGEAKLLADIEVEEQNHAEMMFRYKTVNSMC